MNLQMNLSLAHGYTSQSQIAKVLTENWLANECYCPSCLSLLSQAKANSRVLDFVCSSCSNQFELKSKKGVFGRKISDGAYSSMIDRLIDSNSPHFFFLNYSIDFKVRNLVVVPSYFLQPSLIERRKPLSDKARRAGWVGCNIITSQIPEAGKISIVKEYQAVNARLVKRAWAKTYFLSDEKNSESRSWVLDIISCIERLNQQTFSLQKMYDFENELSLKHPNNHHVKDKIRQQLQVLRDKGYIDFVRPGLYKLSGE